jgi:hypothetical protein
LNRAALVEQVAARAQLLRRAHSPCLLDVLAVKFREQ